MREVSTFVFWIMMTRPEMINRLYKSVKDNKCDIAITSAYHISDNDYQVFIQYMLPEDIAVGTDEFIHRHCI